MKRRQRGEGDGTLEADTGMMQAQGKECQQSPEATRGKGGFSPRATKGKVVLPLFDFRLLVSVSLGK